MTQKEKQQYAVGACALISVGIISITAFVASHVKEIPTNALNYNKVASDLVKEKMEILGYVPIPKTIETDKKEDYVLFPGQTLVNALNRNNVKYCTISGEYYTENGDNIAFIRTFQEIDATPVEMFDPVTKEIVIDYQAPVGYIVVGRKAQRIRTKTFVLTDGVITDKMKRVEDGEFIEDIKIFSSKPYSSILNSDVVVDVPEEKLEEATVEAPVILVPHIKH